MRTLRTCESAVLNTGLSKCPPDFNKVKAALIVPHGVKLPAELDAETLEKLIHEDRSARVYGVGLFVEYAKNGGEVQVSATGYGPEQVTGVSAWRDTFTMEKFYPELNAALLRVANQRYDVYFIDEDGLLFGNADGTDVLAGIAMANIYPDSTPHATSGAMATMTVNFSHLNPKKSYLKFDYRKVDFQPEDIELGLTEVKFEKGDEGYKIYEVIGGNDLTGQYGPLLQEAGAEAFEGNPTTVSYDAAKNVIVITGGEDAVSLKSPKELYEKGIKGIEAV